MFQKIVTILSILSAVGSALLLNFTNPSQAGPFGILAFFILLYMFILGIISNFIFIINKVLVFIYSNIDTKKPYKDRDFKRIYYYSTVLALAPIILIAQQSVGRVGLFEIMLVVFFEIIACIYISKR